jgi:putative membrane protein
MTNGIWNDWHVGWGGFPGFGIATLAFSSVGNRGCTHRVPRSAGRLPRKEALDILDARYARGEIRTALAGTRVQR